MDFKGFEIVDRSYDFTAICRVSDKEHIYIDKRLLLFYNGYALNEKDIELIIFLSISSRVLQASELMLKRMFKINLRRI